MTNNLPLPLSSNVSWVGVNDTETLLFEGLWRIPEGVSYNSYLIAGSEKTALIDSVHAKNALEHFDKISKLTDLSKLDYLIINHMEPDHTGAVPELLKKSPDAKVVFTQIAQTIFKKFYGFDPPAITVKGDNFEISLGSKTLRFIQTPWLHWPETMSTYLIEDRILFSCDAFGSFKKLPPGAILESDFDTVKENICGCMQKYFGSVFNGQREWILRAVEKLEKMNVEIKVLAPSHGPVYTNNVKQTMSKWSSWSKEIYTKMVVVPYGTMCGMTAACLNAITEGVAQAGGLAVTFNLSEDKAVDVDCLGGGSSPDHWFTDV